MVIIYTFDQMVKMMQPLCFLRLFQAKSKDGEIKFVNIRAYHLGIIGLSLEFLGVIVMMFQHYYARGISGIKPLLTMAVLLLVTILRGYFLLRKGKHIASILNKLEKIFPRGLKLQQHYEIEVMVKRIRHRYGIFEIFMAMGLVCLNAKALYLFVVAFRSGSPINDDCFPIPSWYPFDLKHSYALYPFLYIMECLVILNGALFTMYWNHIYSMLLTQICEHYKNVAKIFGEMDARESMSRLTSGILRDRIHDLIKHLQLLDNLCVDINIAFLTPLIITDAICVIAICLQVFIISNEHLFSIVQHIVPAIITSWMIYETSRYGEMLEQASNDVGDGIYNHNWYEGSLDHRKQVLVLLQWRNEPRRLSWGKSFFNINHLHFVQIMTMAYQLYSFQQSLQ